MVPHFTERFQYDHFGRRAMFGHGLFYQHRLHFVYFNHVEMPWMRYSACMNVCICR